LKKDSSLFISIFFSSLLYSSKNAPHKKYRKFKLKANQKPEIEELGKNYLHEISSNKYKTHQVKN
jgi:hypothetical protein